MTSHNTPLNESLRAAEPTSAHGMSRRHLLRNAGLLTATGALLAACGEPGPSGIARLGEAPAIEGLADETVTDVVLLRTAMSVEKMVHGAMISDTLATGANEGPMKALAVGHETALATLSTLVTARKGEPYNEANARLTANWLTKALDLVSTSDVAEEHGRALAHALQTILASTYQSFITQTTDGALRADMMRLGAAASRRATVVASLLAPGTKGFVPGVDETGAATYSQLPHRFGTLASVQVTLGKADESGIRPVVTMETPSLNSFIW